jgi:endonuclease YncB( thermonuclease family)
MKHSPDFHRQIGTSRARPARSGSPGAWLAGIAILSAAGFGWTTAERLLPDVALRGEAGTGDAVRATFGLCHRGGGTNCVVDGDTIWIGGEKVRIADIDAPETHPPRCAEEARLGEAATVRLQALLNAGPVTLASIDRDTDRYGRKLRVVMRGGVSLGDALVREGLARPYGGGRRPWC